MEIQRPAACSFLVQTLQVLQCARTTHVKQTCAVLDGQKLHNNNTPCKCFMNAVQTHDPKAELL